MPTHPHLNILSTKFFPNEPWNESEALDALTWLWYQSITHRQVPILMKWHRHIISHPTTICATTMPIGDFIDIATTP
jgi:hypothetical protein